MPSTVDFSRAARDRRCAAEERAIAARAARRPTTARAAPPDFEAELDAAVADGRILATCKSRYRATARRDGEEKTIRLLRSLSPGVDPATHAVLAASRGVGDDKGPWMTPRARVAPGQVLSAGRRPDLVAGDRSAGPRRRPRIDWSLDAADEEVVQASGPDLSAPPFTAPPPPLVPQPGHPRANGHGETKPKRTPPGRVIDGNPKA
jgi:hypothetical protein